jgi:5-methylcytosine-specific restriction endonuclease McrA
MTRLAHTCPRCGRINPRHTTCPCTPRRPTSRPELNRSAWQRLRHYVKQRDGNQCTACGSTLHLEAAHITAPRHGGTDSTDNLITLCRTCHRRRDAAEDKARRMAQDKPVFGPAAITHAARSARVSSRSRGEGRDSG